MVVAAFAIQAHARRAILVWHQALLPGDNASHAGVRPQVMDKHLIAAVIIVDFIAGAILELALQGVFVRALLRVILVFAWLVVLLIMGHVTEFWIVGIARFSYPMLFVAMSVSI